MKCCGASGPTVETHCNLGLGATSPRLLAPPGPFKSLARTGPTVEKRVLMQSGTSLKIKFIHSFLILES